MYPIIFHHLAFPKTRYNAQSDKNGQTKNVIIFTNTTNRIKIIPLLHLSALCAGLPGLTGMTKIY